MKLKESYQSQNRQSISARKKQSFSRASSGSITPRRKVKVIKEFSQTRYGVPIDCQIQQIDASNQSVRQATGYNTILRTACPQCSQQTQDVDTQKCGRTACLWGILLSPCCLCLIPVWFRSCRDTDKKCVQCWKTKKKISATFCCCQ